ncbi:hypothetical protein ACQ33O_09215 [Ferruginibacter sp. SUN002]|uniref:hypothetical protein n=1 Tax=Ferruginibacter sp. SUN002 TaxID=2937789 RepID=UPI003D35FA5C
MRRLYFVLFLVLLSRCAVSQTTQLKDSIMEARIYDSVIAAIAIHMDTADYEYLKALKKNELKTVACIFFWKVLSR